MGKPTNGKKACLWTGVILFSLFAVAFLVLTIA